MINVDERFIQINLRASRTAPAITIGSNRGQVTPSIRYHLLVLFQRAASRRLTIDEAGTL
jgi:hypothetical protein